MAIVRAAEELRVEWENMLAHQLPALPAIDHMFERASEMLAWLDEVPAPPPARAVLGPVPARAGEILHAPRGGQYWGSGQRLDLVRFAGANRLMIEFDYDGKHRIAEPYSLRRPATGNLLVYAWERGGTTIKSFDAKKMRDVRVSTVPFMPRYVVEFTV
jgi:hypothetical protein